YDTLVTLDKDLKIQPDLATSWDQPDPKTYIFHLRSGVKFQDGTDFNADAVKFSLDRYRTTATSPRASELVDVASVDVVDPMTVKVTMKNASAPFLATLVDRSGMITSPAATQAGGDNFTRAPMKAGTGPFQFVEWQGGDHITLEKNPNYWKKDASGGALPYADKVTYRFFPDASVRLTNLKTGDQDIQYRIDPKDVADVKNNPDIVFNQAPGLAWDGLTLNVKQAPFDNKEVRQAFAYAIDRPTIVKNVFFNVYSEAQYPISPALSAYYDPSLKPYTRDVNKAKALLAQAGASNVTFSLDTTNTPATIQVSQLIKDELAEAGITVNINLLEFTKQIDTASKHMFQASAFGWSGRVDPDGDISYSHLHTGGGNNYGQYSNPQVDDLLDKARVAQTPEDRKPLYLQAMKTVTDDSPIIYLDFQPAFEIHRKNVQGYSFIPDGMIHLEGVWLS
ncbi:MAG: ABC transporter substrate-binding protein, partial [Chloroflexi bacterium]|nr:ABC transporter substrate-binding protein [Chloroflexota bacterium]